jgi:hypothetical protein
MATGDFQIVVSDFSSSAEEWKRALSADDSKLPELSEEQKKWAKRFGVTEKEYARGVLAGHYGNERMKKKGRALGEQVEEILEGLGPQYKLIAVLWQGSRLRWLLRIQTPAQVLGVPVSFEMADDVLDSGILEEIEKLRVTVLTGVGRSELIVK